MRTNEARHKQQGLQGQVGVIELEFWKVDSAVSKLQTRPRQLSLSICRARSGPRSPRKVSYLAALEVVRCRTVTALAIAIDRSMVHPTQQQQAMVTVGIPTKPLLWRYNTSWVLRGVHWKNWTSPWTAWTTRQLSSWRTALAALALEVDESWWKLTQPMRDAARRTFCRKIQDSQQPGCNGKSLATDFNQHQFHNH